MVKHGETKDQAHLPALFFFWVRCRNRWQLSTNLQRWQVDLQQLFEMIDVDGTWKTWCFLHRFLMGEKREVIYHGLMMIHGIFYDFLMD